MSNPLYKFINGKRIPILKSIPCLVCKKIFTPKVSKRKYCSRQCYYTMKKIRKDRVKWTDKMRKDLSKKYTGKGNPMYGKPCWNKGKKRWEISGEKNGNWKSGFSISQIGYKVIQNNKETDGKKILEHRKVMEEYLGRKLNSKEIVHHINHDKLDNRIKNLMIVTRKEHIKIHPPRCLDL